MAPPVRFERIPRPGDTRSYDDAMDVGSPLGLRARTYVPIGWNTDWDMF